MQAGSSKEFIPFLFLLNLYQVGYVEIKDEVITEENNPNNMLSDFPENYIKKYIQMEMLVVIASDMEGQLLKIIIHSN